MKKRPCEVCGNLISFYDSQSKTGMCLNCVNSVKKKQYLSNWLRNGLTTKGKPSTWIREYILNDQNHVCDICRLNPNWNGKALVFILDHINGDSTNNNRSNLRLICPNCDSQLPTYKNKNRGNGLKYYRDAGNLRYSRKVGRVDDSIALEKRQV